MSSPIIYVLSILLATLVLLLAALARAEETNGLTLFYAKNPTQDQIRTFSSGSFTNWPPSPYECANDLSNPMAALNFSCNSTANATPETIRDYGTPMPPCMEFDVIFEHLKWGTWAHKCWAVPANPDDSEEVAFQSNALEARHVVLYQHDAHLYTINKAIEALYVGKEESIHKNIIERDAKLADIDAWVVKEKAKAAGYWFMGRWINNLHTLHQADKKRSVVRKESEAAIPALEKQFWADSYPHRMAVVELDHLVGIYFERHMQGRTAECRDWAGYGVPDPELPPN